MKYLEQKAGRNGEILRIKINCPESGILANILWITIYHTLVFKERAWEYDMCRLRHAGPHGVAGNWH